MRYLPIIACLSVGFFFWLLDSLWNFFGKQFLEGFYFAGGLHPGEQYIYIITLSIISILSSIFIFFSNKTKISLILILYFCFLLFVWISTLIFSVDKFESLREFWAYTLMLFICFYAYNFVINQNDKEEFLYNYSLMLLTLFVVSILVAIVVSLGLPPGSPWMSFFYQKNAYGGFVLLFIPIAFSLFIYSFIYREYLKSTLFFIAFIFGVFTLIFSASKASFLSFIIASPLYMGLIRVANIANLKNIDKRTKTIFISSVSVSLFLLILQFILDKKFTSSLINAMKSVISSLSNTVIARVDFWEASIKIAHDFPFGCGLYNFSKVYPLYQATFYLYSKDPHNYYLKLISEVGFLGLISFLLIIFYFLYKAFMLHKQVDLSLVNSEEYKENINLEKFEPNFKEKISKLGIFVLSSGISIGIIQSLIHVAFDVDFKFLYIFIIFLINLFINLAIIESFDKNTVNNNQLINKIIGSIFIIISLFSLYFGIVEAKAYRIDKLVEKTGNYKDYLEAIRNSFPASSKYVTMAELYRISYNMEEAIKCNKQAIKLSKYNINAYLSLAYIYNDKIETLLSINTKEKNLDNKIKEGIIENSNNLKNVAKEAFKYDNKNYPDLYLLLAQSYEYKGSKNYKNLYRIIFIIIYPPQEYTNLMDIRYKTFGDVIAQAYIKYFIKDFLDCQKGKNIDKCKEVSNYLYEPIVKYNIQTDIQDFYLLGALSSYITAKKLYVINKEESKQYFQQAKNILEKIYTNDFVNLYYYTACNLYLENIPTALELAKIIVKFPFLDKMSEDQKEKLKIAKINTYSILAFIYSKKEEKLAKYYEKLYRKYEKNR